MIASRGTAALCLMEVRPAAAVKFWPIIGKYSGLYWPIRGQYLPVKSWPGELLSARNSEVIVTLSGDFWNSIDRLEPSIIGQSEASINLDAVDVFWQHLGELGLDALQISLLDQHNLLTGANISCVIASFPEKSHLLLNEWWCDDVGEEKLLFCSVVCWA